ncbi:hypothetical protein AAMO2058_001577100 [Amorphochlora amoebiformis]
MLLLLAVMAVADSRLQSPRHRQVLRRICRPSPHISRVSRHRDFMPSEKYDYSLPTNEVYRSPNESISGPFASSRRTLDYTYHSHYVKARRVLQDIIVLNFLKRGLAAREYTQEADQASTLNGNWIVFTAGAMGSGKGYTMRWLGDQGLFPIHSFVWVDADEIRTNLPEWEGYIAHDAGHAAMQTQRETGMICEILVQELLKRNHSILIDGTLRDHKWYKKAFGELRKFFPTHNIAIIHVTAPLQMIKQRARSRARKTGRVVTDENIDESYLQVPDSIRILRGDVDFFSRIHNQNGSPIIIEPSGDIFRSTWVGSEKK